MNRDMIPDEEGGAVVEAEAAGVAPVETDEEAFLEAAREDEEAAVGKTGETPDGAVTPEGDAAAESDVVVLDGKVEAILFSSEFPLGAKRLAQITRRDKRTILESIDRLNVFYGETGRAFRVVDLAGGFQLVTTSDHAEILTKLHKEKVPTRLSRAALETLSIIVFKQPATRAEIDSIRGVPSDRPQARADRGPRRGAGSAAPLRHHPGVPRVLRAGDGGRSPAHGRARGASRRRNPESCNFGRRDPGCARRGARAGGS